MSAHYHARIFRSAHAWLRSPIMQWQRLCNSSRGGHIPRVLAIFDAGLQQRHCPDGIRSCCPSNPRVRRAGPYRAVDRLELVRRSNLLHPELTLAARKRQGPMKIASLTPTGATKSKRLQIEWPRFNDLLGARRCGWMLCHLTGEAWPRFGPSGALDILTSPASVAGDRPMAASESHSQRTGKSWCVPLNPLRTVSRGSPTRTCESTRRVRSRSVETRISPPCARSATR